MHTIVALVDVGIHTITAITRTNSTSSFPSNVKVCRGSYDDAAFITFALERYNIFILLLGLMAPTSAGFIVIYAAAKSGMPWVLPTEVGCDYGNPRKEVLAMTIKDQYREWIEQRGVSSWIGTVSNPWFDFSLKSGLFGIGIPMRTARLYDNGTVKATTTTLRKMG